MFQSFSQKSKKIFWEEFTMFKAFNFIETAFSEFQRFLEFTEMNFRWE